jgi:uncharacterized protein YecT (DUF1311 family)
MNLSKLTATAFIATLAVAAAAHARAEGTYKADHEFATCVGKVRDGDNGGTYECSKGLLTREEGRLQQTWNTVYKGLTDTDVKARLLADQRRWVAFKDQTCGFWATDSGAMGHAQFPLCVAEIVAARRGFLKEIGDWP